MLSEYILLWVLWRIQQVLLYYTYAGKWYSRNCSYAWNLQKVKVIRLFTFERVPDVSLKIFDRKFGGILACNNVTVYCNEVKVEGVDFFKD